MRYLKKTGYIVAVMCLFFFTACGDDDGDLERYYRTSFINIYVSTDVEKVVVGSSTSFYVSTENTDYNISGPADAGCIKAGNGGVVCTPTKAGEYTIRITATADPAKIVSKKINAVTVSISPKFASIEMGKSTVFIVETQDAEFEVFESPLPGAVCRTEGIIFLVCKPVRPEVYTITIKAITDGTTDTAILKVTGQPLEQITISDAYGMISTSVPVNTSIDYSVGPPNMYYTVSTNPSSGITCAKNDDYVSCVATLTGTYVIRVSSADPTNYAEVLLTATAEE